MKGWLKIAALGLIVFALAGCGGRESDGSVRTGPVGTGPAMVMFYTDN